MSASPSKRLAAAASVADPVPPEPQPPADSTSTSIAVIQLIAIIAIVSSLSLQTDKGKPTSPDAPPTLSLAITQFVVVVAALAFFGYVTRKVSAPTQALESARAARLKAAVAEAGNTGLTDEWYNSANKALEQIKTAVFLAAGVFVLASGAKAMPGPIVDLWTKWIEGGWHYLHDNYSPAVLFMGGVYGCHMAAYWGSSVLYGLLDAFRPSWALPYKVQENVKIPPKQYAKGVALTLFNQLLALPVLYGLYKLYPSVSPMGFDKELPGLGTTILQLLVCLPFAEVTFYSVHRLLHLPTPYKYIHYVHHSWTSPVSATAAYAHPIEFIFGNVSVLAMGPMVLGVHVTTFWLWVVFSTIETCHSHSGWHLPFLGSNEAHDFHHSAGYDNLGVTGVLDTAFGTNKIFKQSYIAKVDKNYSTADLPVDRILAMNSEMRARVQANPTLRV